MALTTIGLMALLGCFTGFLAGLLGIGGGMIITPFLIMLIPSSLIPHDHIVHVAIATSLATIAFTSLSSVRAHHKRGAVLWNVVASVAPGILIGAVLGAQIAGWLSAFCISIVFAVFVGFSAIKMFMNKSPRPDRNLPGTIGKFFMGIAIGVLSALVGAGGGIYLCSLDGLVQRQNAERRCNQCCFWLPHCAFRNDRVHHQWLERARFASMADRSWLHLHSCVVCRCDPQCFAGPSWCKDCSLNRH